MNRKTRNRKKEKYTEGRTNEGQKEITKEIKKGKTHYRKMSQIVKGN